MAAHQTLAPSQIKLVLIFEEIFIVFIVLKEITIHYSQNILGLLTLKDTAKLQPKIPRKLGKGDAPAS